MLELQSLPMPLHQTISRVGAKGFVAGALVSLLKHRTYLKSYSPWTDKNDMPLPVHPSQLLSHLETRDCTRDLTLLNNSQPEVKAGDEGISFSAEDPMIFGWSKVFLRVLGSCLQR
jgi:hypothetical protein